MNLRNCFRLGVIVSWIAAIAFMLHGDEDFAGGALFFSIVCSMLLLWARRARHRCNRCGQRQYVIHEEGPVAGTHTHICDRCGYAWYH